MRLKESGKPLFKNGNDANLVGRTKMKNAANSMGRGSKEVQIIFVLVISKL